MSGIGTFFTAIKAAWALYKEGRTIESLKKELEVAESNLARADQSHAHLHQEKAKLESEIAELKARLAAWESFIPFDGVLFRRLPDGSIESATYCPNCRLPLYARGPETRQGRVQLFRLMCKVCGWVSMMTVPRASQIIAALRANSPGGHVPGLRGTKKG